MTGMSKQELFAQLPPKKNQYVDLTKVDYSSQISSIAPEILKKTGEMQVEEISDVEDNRISRSKTSAFVDFTATKGIRINIPKNAEASIETRSNANGRNAERNIIVLEENSKATITWEMAGNGFLASSTDFVLKSGSELNLNEIQDLSEESTILNHHEARLQKDSKLKWTVVTLGSRMQSAERHIQLLEQGAEANLVEVFFGNRSQLLDHNLTMNHRSPNTYGNVLSKGILKDHARNVFFGLIKIEEGAQKTNSFLAQHAMLMSENAICNSVPSLEIAANDVKASHSASVGQIDAEQIFYLTSRGIPEAEARKMIAQGFLDPAFARIPSVEIKERLRLRVEKKWSD